ncbi:hypothetical protein N657DRAFT_655375 [Parathielavia appendiculata]|uniref:Phosphoribosylaminoimidazole-succinocarboxamide synthase n=1 Tax=Parathielavia appendiculata TaxID=2587402 RepID=A0AAN6Z5W2_9PEZI|nr:hypothetical protein N657DRAFT_655375 [Parathielavia appendiculata]
MTSHNSHSLDLDDHVDHSQGPHLQHPPKLRLQTQTSHQTAAPYSPSPLTPTASSELDFDSQDGVFGPPPVARPHGRPVVIEGPYCRVSDIPPLAPYQQPGWEVSMSAAMVTDFRDELARLDGVITPGVDNTPFIQYAIEALTRDRDTGYSTAAPSGSSGTVLGPGQHRHSYQPGPNHQHSRRPVSLPPRPAVVHPPAPAEAARLQAQQHHFPLPYIPGPRESAHSLAESLLKKGPRPPQPHEWMPVETEDLLTNGAALPPLTFRPWPLRAPALFGFMAVCVLMIAALILSAVYSHLHQGLREWETIYGGRYFLFRLLPQLMAAGILLYAQFLVTTVFRMLPFVRLASKIPAEREGALFQELYPSFLWPRLVGPWNVWVPVLVTWLMNFTLSLQSSLFTVILVDGIWTWATVQGVAWTLVALYLALLISTVLVWRYWATLETTGLIWDPRSLADIASLVSETNTAEDYRGTQLARSRDGIRFALRRRTADRLCYWTWKDGRHGFWHTLGSPMDETNLIPVPDLTAGQRMQRLDEKHDQAALPDTDPAHHDIESTHQRNRYLPFPLRTSQLLWHTLTGTILLLAIFIATFLPATRIAAGFPPKLSSAPQPGAFSPADFLYSFLPALLGTIAFLSFQPLDTHLRVLQPWAALSSDQVRGADAESSLLADYAACGPWGECTLRALRNGHWRVAVVSLLSGLFVLIPVLAGASFMALTVAPAATDDGGGGSSSADGWEEQEVRMFVNMPAYGILLGLLVLYVVGLAVLFPRRKAFRMPHAVTCLAEVVGYLVNSEIREEPAFKRCVSRQEMAGKLGFGSGSPAGMQSWWVFGFGETGGMGGGELGVRRVKRFTEKRRVRKSQIRRPLL